MKSSDPRASRPRQVHALRQAGRSRASRHGAALQNHLLPPPAPTAEVGGRRLSLPCKNYKPQHALRAGAAHDGICGFPGSPAHVRAGGSRHAGG